MRIALVLFPLLLAAPRARADVSLARAALGSCSIRDAAYFRDRDSPRVRRFLHAEAPLDFVQAGARHLLFATWHWPGEARSSQVIDTATGHAALTIGEDRAALVEAPDGTLVGLLFLDEDRHELRLWGADDRPKWRVSVPGLYGDSASALVDGGRLVVATFDRISSGSELMAFDLATGRRIWTADVEQLDIPHSKYWNDVTVEKSGDSLILRGIEAGGCYLQVFDAATGRRRSSVIDKR